MTVVVRYQVVGLKSQ